MSDEFIKGECLGVRALRALEMLKASGRLQSYSAQHVAELTRGDLLSLTNIGRKSVNEIAAHLYWQYGLKLKEDPKKKFTEPKHITAARERHSLVQERLAAGKKVSEIAVELGVSVKRIYQMNAKNKAIAARKGVGR